MDMSYPKINFFGDSITAGRRLDKIIEQRFTTLLEKSLKIKALNYGVSGSRIAKIDTDEVKCFLDRLFNITQKADFTFVFGGINDYKNGTIIGDKNSQEISTFFGAMKFLISELLKRWKPEQICFILPLPAKRKSPINEDLNKYYEIIKELCLENNIDILDIRENFDGKIKELYVDGLHPNDKGHEIIANELKKYILKKGIVKE